MTQAKMEKLSSVQMAAFAARGFLQLDGVVPDNINLAFLSATAPQGDQATLNATTAGEYYGKLLESNLIPKIPPGLNLVDAYKDNEILSALIDLPVLKGAIASLVGEDCIFDHHFLHITFPPTYLNSETGVSQNLHQDSTIDPRHSFDLQVMYFPQAVTPEMGGTRYVPSTHLRVVSEASIGRYQNIVGQQQVVCPAGTLLLVHHGLWHGGGANHSDEIRYMFKIRLCPNQRQVRLWDTSDLPDDHAQQRPIFWKTLAPGSDNGGLPVDPIQNLLTQSEPWFEFDTGRLEYLNRIRFWRMLLGDDKFDADYWLTRIENEHFS